MTFGIFFEPEPPDLSVGLGPQPFPCGKTIGLCPPVGLGTNGAVTIIACFGASPAHEKISIDVASALKQRLG